MGIEVDAIILGLNPTGLGVLQALGMREVSLIGVDANRHEIGFFSKFGRKYACNTSELVGWLCRLGKKLNKKAIIFPTSDDYLLLLSRNEKTLEKFFSFPFSDNSLVEKLLDKYKFYQLASKYTDKLPVCQLLGRGDLSGWKQWPAIVKPVHIHEFRKYFPNLKAWVVRNERELAAKNRILSRLGIRAMIQEIVKGPDHEQYSVCVYIDRDGLPKEAMVAQKIRQSPPGFGVGTYVRLTSEKKLKEGTLDFLKKIRFRGIGEIEYKRDENDGEFKLIEINPRVWTQNKLASYSGTDIIGAAYSDHMGENLRPLQGKADKWFFVVRDIPTCLQYIKRGELRIQDMLKAYSGPAIKVDSVWCSQDPSVLAGFPFYLTWKLISHFKTCIPGKCNGKNRTTA